MMGIEITHGVVSLAPKKCLTMFFKELSGKVGSNKTQVQVLGNLEEDITSFNNFLPYSSFSFVFIVAIAKTVIAMTMVLLSLIVIIEGEVKRKRKRKDEW